MELKMLIEQEIQINTPINKQFLLNLKSHPLLGIGVEVVYVYSLIDEEINYPLKKGTVLYIGEAKRTREPTGSRFQHIAKSQFVGANSVNNYTLTQYYYKGCKIKIKIYEVPASEERTLLENKLINMHVYIFGAKPIAQGTTGDGYKINMVHQLASRSRDFEQYIK